MQAYQTLPVNYDHMIYFYIKIAIAIVVGTIFSLVSVLLLILTLTDQFHQNKLDSFGQTFYEMLHIHNDNITSMSLKDSDNTTGRDVFSKLVSQYEVIYDTVQGCFNNILLINSLSAKDNEVQKDKLGKMKTLTLTKCVPIK